MGMDITERYSGTGSVLGGVIEAENVHGFRGVPLLSTSAPSSGPVTPETASKLGEALTEAYAAHADEIEGVVLELSGAMTTTDCRSGDEIILAALRHIAPDIPIIVAFSPQANMCDPIVRHCSMIITSRPGTEPTLQDVGKNAVAHLTSFSESKPVSPPQLHKLPLLIPIAAQRADEDPLASIYAEIDTHVDDATRDSIQLFAGYPYADTPDAGAAIIVNDVPGHQAPDGEMIASNLWKRRAEFFVNGSNVEEAVHHAMDSKSGPVLIADLGDNPDDGAPGDGTTILWALIDLGVRNATVAAIADEQAVSACVNAGAGARVEIPVGGRKDTRHGYPIDIRARVTSIHSCEFALSGPVNHGIRVDAGTVVVLDVEARHDGHVELFLTEKPIQITDPAFFEHIGIDLSERAIVSIKSTSDYRAAFLPLASEIFEVITPGITTPDPAFFQFQNIRRPIFPLDPME